MKTFLVGVLTLVLVRPRMSLKTGPRPRTWAVSLSGSSGSVETGVALVWMAATKDLAVLSLSW